MYFPQLKQKPAQQAVTAIFGGLNRAEEISDGQFARELNLSTREYPMLCPRLPRGIGATMSATYRGMIEKNGKLVTIRGNRVFYGEDMVGGITLSESTDMLSKRMVSMGAYVLIFPDKKYFNSVDLSDCGSIEANYQSTGTVTFKMCRLDGSDFDRLTESREAPEKPENGEYWYDLGSTPRRLMQYSGVTGTWQTVNTVYTRIGAAGINQQIKAGDTVEISGITIDEYVPEYETRDAGPGEHLVIYDSDADEMEKLEVVFEPTQTGTGQPSEYNVRNFVGYDGCTIHISPTAQADPDTDIEVNWSIAADTLYGFKLDVITGKLTKTHERIASFSHSTHGSFIRDKIWWSSKDEYVEGTEPSNGAEVIYLLAGMDVIAMQDRSNSLPVVEEEYDLDPHQPETTRGTNHIWADAGQVAATYVYYDPNYATAKEQAEGLNGSQYVYDAGENWITVVGVLDENVQQSTGSITVKRQCPDMEYVVESNNRLWGCHYGPDGSGGTLNEIYACKLGDFKNWRVYQGISTDSYDVSIGSDGPFTGAIAYGGMPMFFKETCVHKVYGSQPKNFQIMTTQLPGVQNGSGGSLKLVNGTAYYLSPSGVMAYDGSYPVRVSMALGDEPMSAGKAGALGEKYYIQVTQGGQPRMYVLDTRLNIWHEENAEQLVALAAMGNDLYMLLPHRIDTVMGSAGTKEAAVQWYAETGLQGWEQFSKKAIGAADDKYFTKFFIRAAVQEGCELSCKIQYDGKGPWHEKLNLKNCGAEKSTRLMPVYPKRCDHMKLRLEGVGETKIHSLIRTVSSGGDGKRG